MNVYLEAAKLLAEDVFNCGESCIAINEAAGHQSNLNRPFKLCKEAKKYTMLFKPKNPPDNLNWLYGQFETKEGLTDFAAKREWRLTALCFAAAMHETGDL